MLNVPHLIFFCTVWGEYHSTLFANFGLPSLMTAGNIPYLCGSGTSTQEFVIYTRKEDIQTIEASPAMPTLRRLMNVSIRLLPETGWTDWPMFVNWANRDVLRTCEHPEPHIMFVWPDVVWCEQYCFSILDKILQGYDIVFSVGIRTNRIQVEPILQQRMASQPGVLQLSSGELVQLGMKTMHRQYLEYIYEAPRFTSWPAVLLFPIGEEGTIMRTFHVHVPVLKARRDILPDINPFETIDGGTMVGKLIQEGHRFYYMQDSEECFHIELSRHDYMPHLSGPYGFDEVDTAVWATKELSSYHLTTAAQTFYLHAGPCDARYRMRAQESQKVMDSVLRWHAFLTSHPENLQLVERHDQHRMSLLQQLETNHLLSKGLNLEHLIWKMLQGDTAEIEHHAGLLIARSMHQNKQLPDPIDWAWYLISYVVIGKLDEATKKQRLMPTVQHVEVERARWLLNTLRFKSLIPFESHLDVSEYHFSKHPSYIKDFRGWLMFVISLLIINKRSEEAALLSQYEHVVSTESL